MILYWIQFLATKKKYFLMRLMYIYYQYYIFVSKFQTESEIKAFFLITSDMVGLAVGFSRHVVSIRLVTLTTLIVFSVYKLVM